MSLPTKIVVIGAGSASFGENTLAALLHSQSLRGSTLALVDKNPASLDIVKRLADRLNEEWHAQMTIHTFTNHHESLSGAAFVISAIEVGARESLWKRDFEIPLKYGVHQPYAENGGPGGFAHAARNIGPVMEIVRDMEQLCPNAWFINFTNPMIRICDAVNRHSSIKAIGLCHQIFAGYRMVAVALALEYGIAVPPELTGMHAAVDQVAAHESLKRQILPHIEIQAAGLNHFTWMLAIRDAKTGEDLYPLFRKRFFELDPKFEPLTRDIFSVFGLFPVPGDAHLCEYLPWLSDPHTRPWEKYDIKLYDWGLMAGVRDYQLDRLKDMADGKMTIEGLMDTDSEGALEIIESVSGEGTHHHLAANLINHGQIANLPLGATVETPAVADAEGIQPVPVGALPESIAELCRRETTVAQLCVDAAVEGDRQKALQSLLLDPVITDISTAKAVLNDYLTSYREYLPQFWK